jgi:hypothetical protein
VYLVLLLELEDCRQVDERALHRVQTLNDDHNLLPRPVRLRLALGDDFAEELLERAHVVVLVHAHARAREAHADADARVVELVRDDQAALADERRNDRRVRREAHAEDRRVFVADEAGHERLGLLVQVERAALETRAAGGNAVPLQALLNDVRTSAARLGKTQVVVRRDVQCTRPGPRRLQRRVVVRRVPVEESNRAAGDTGHRLGEAVVNAGLEAARVEGV